MEIKHSVKFPLVWRLKEVKLKPHVFISSCLIQSTSESTVIVDHLDGLLYSLLTAGSEVVFGSGSRFLTFDRREDTQLLPSRPAPRHPAEQRASVEATLLQTHNIFLRGH